jgi:spermidine synthase
LVLPGAILLRGPRSSRGWAAAALLLLGVGSALWNPNGLPRTHLNAAANEQLLWLREGSHGIVAVVEQIGSRRIKLDNSYILGGTAAAGDERMQAHIPLLLHPSPKQVAFLGLGTAIPAGAALFHPVEKIIAVELVPEVAQAAADYFADYNLGISRSRRAEIRVEDARNFVRGASNKYDVIIGDLVVPWRRGEAGLYSVDHFRAVRRCLNPGGLFCQWLPLFQLSREEFMIVAATFSDVFPNATVWHGDFSPHQPAIGLIGNNDNAPLDPEIVSQRIRQLNQDELNPQLAHAAGLWMYLAGYLPMQNRELLNARRNDENHPWLELLGPLSHAGGTGNVGLFVGKELQAWLSEIRESSLVSSPLARLDQSHLQWWKAGIAVREASQLMFEGKTSAANVRMRQAAVDLPPEVQRTLLP